MSALSHDVWPWLGQVIVISGYVAVGAVGGGLFFRALWWNTRVIVGGGEVSKVVALALGRYFLIGGLLALATFKGAAPLLATAVGVFIGRFLVLRSIGSDRP